MGNRAVITASKSRHVAGSKDLGVYLHWNGGRDSVEAFLKYCELLGLRAPDRDNYGYAGLVRVVSNYFADGLSVGIDRCEVLDCDNWDNGVYIIEGWQIVGRQYFKGREQCTYPLLDMLLDIDQAQPAAIQLGEEKIKAALAAEAEAVM